jgi:hypothetical protein
MEPLKRKIGYDRKSGKSDGPADAGKKAMYLMDEAGLIPQETDIKNVIFKSVNVVQSITIKANDKRTRSEKVIGYFKSHPLVSMKGVCDEANIDVSNFKKLWKSAKGIPDKLLDKIEPIIKKYGYV